jgi:hypothetical protein
MKNDDTFDYLNDFYVLGCFLKGVSCNSPLALFLCDFIVIFHPKGEPRLPHLLCCSAFAVEHHSVIRCALHLRQPRLVNNPG